MKFFAVVLFVAMCACALSAPPQQQHQQEAQILRYDADVQPEGYKFAVETSDGKSHQEEGQLKNIGTEQEAISVRGSFSFVGDDGVTYTVNYLADENGFQPQGEHLPRV